MTLTRWACCPECGQETVVIFPLAGGPAKYPAHTRPDGFRRRRRCDASGWVVEDSDLAAALPDLDVGARP